MKVKVDNKKALVLTFGVLLMIGTIFGLSYAYFDDEEDPRQSSTMELTSANLTAEFTDSSEISIENMLPGQSVSKTFVVSNTGIVPLTYDLVFDSVESTFTLDDFVYTLTSTNGGGSVAETIMPTVNGTLVTNILAPAETTQTYILTISLKNDPLNDQSADRNATFDGRIKLISPYGSDGTFTFRDFQYTGNGEEFVVPETGLYKIETWGAQGGAVNTSYPGGKGGYTSGEIYLLEGTKLYVYVGGAGVKGNGIAASAGYNGGSTSGKTGVMSSSGGGATDVRLVSAKWDNTLSLNSRIIVSGGGGGAYSKVAGGGGGLIGISAGDYTFSSTTVSVTGGTQTSGGLNSNWGSRQSDFGKGGLWLNDNGGGGGGYYGGGTGVGYSSSSAGGSSYISGHAGSIAIQEGSVTNPRAIKTGCTSTSTSRECSIHYSEYSFSNTVMIDGAGYSWTTEKAVTAGTMPSPTAGTEVGHAGNGYARITLKPKVRVNTTLDNVRYIKDCINGSSANTINHWVEIQAIKDNHNYATDTGVTIEGTANATSGYPYTRIIDGDLTSSNYAEATSGNQCVTIDLKNEYDLDEIRVWHVYADGRTYNENITSVSSDNTSWVTVNSFKEKETSYGKRVNAYERINLYTNGYTELKNNTNFTTLTYNNEGYFSIALSSNNWYSGSEKIAIDPKKTYQFSLTTKSTSSTASGYNGFIEYDIDRQAINPYHVMYRANTLTTLAQELKNGDETIVVNNLDNFIDSSLPYQRSIIFWNYADSTGYEYPELTYSRNYYQDLWKYNESKLNKTTDTISLTTAWTGGTIPAGTKLSQGNDSSTRNYCLKSNSVYTTDWKTVNAFVSGMNTNGGISITKFRAGTKYISLLFAPYANGVANTTFYIKDIGVREY